MARPLTHCPAWRSPVSRLIAICVGLTTATAAAHEGADPLSAWYRSLTTGDGKSCCTMRDCAPAEARINGEHWEVLIRSWEVGDARWVEVPDSAVLRRENPNGLPILCRTPNGFIRCFVPPAGT